MHKATPGKLTLNDIRNALIRQEETIIFSLIERSQFARNNPVYEKGDHGLLAEAGIGDDADFLGYMLRETEKVHALMRRFTSPDEHAFFPGDLPDPILPLLNYDQVIKPNTININPLILRKYKQQIIPLITEDKDDKQYGSAANCDIQALNAISKRVHYGKYVAEIKFLAEQPKYAKLIDENDEEGIMEAITNSKVEEALLERVRAKARNYGQELKAETSGELAEIVANLYKDVVIPLTKKVEVEYLLQRGATETGTPLVAFLGPEGSFTHTATLRYFARSNRSQGPSKSANLPLLPCRTIPDIFSSVLSNKTAYGVAPIQASVVGIVRTTNDILFDTQARVVGEITIPVYLHVAVAKGTQLKQVKKIYSHPHALAEAKKTLSQRFAGVPVFELTSTARAAELASKETGVAAICSEEAAKHFGLEIIMGDVQDDLEKNVTRFLILSKSTQPPQPTGKDKTLMVIGLRDTVGVLLKALQIFASNEINLTQIESHHLTGSLTTSKHVGVESRFLVEIEAHVDDEKMKKAIKELKDLTTFLRVVGSFPNTSDDLVRS